MHKCRSENTRSVWERTLREISAEFGVSCCTCRQSVTVNLAMKRVAAKFIPKLLDLSSADVPEGSQLPGLKKVSVLPHPLIFT